MQESFIKLEGCNDGLKECQYSSQLDDLCCETLWFCSLILIEKMLSWKCFLMDSEWSEGSIEGSCNISKVERLRNRPHIVTYPDTNCS